MTIESVTQSDYEFHPACSMLPKMADDEYAALRESIRKGYDARHPILLFDGLILDGRHRYQACMDEGIAPQFIEWAGGDPFDFVRREHQARRSWVNAEQKVLVCKKLILKSSQFQAEQAKRNAEARKAMSEAAKAQENRNNQYTAKKEVEGVPQLEAHPANEQPEQDQPKKKRDFKEVNANRTSAALAKEIGTNRAAVERANAIEKASPELAEQVANAEITATEALRQIKRAQLQQKSAELPSDKYRVIYADPPWKYNDSKAGVMMGTGAENHYPTMPTKDICLLDVKSMAAEDSVLFMWATFPLLPDALQVINSWGFKYKTAFVWDKVRPNFGNYHNATAELLMVATRGSGTPDENKRFDQVQEVERTGRHSEKPEHFRELIDTLYPVGNRIEMFRRGQAPNGWQVWGNESWESD